MKKKLFLMLICMITCIVAFAGTNVIPSNEIWYTSRNSVVVEPYNPDGFGAKIIKNEYKDGKGIIQFDGPVTSIGNNAFFWCSNLTSLSGFSACETIGEESFINCYNLTLTLMSESVPNVTYNTFNGCEITVIVPHELQSAYKNEWANYIGLGINIETRHPKTEIWYTSKDGNIVSPNGSAFDATIIKNTCKNGCGTITFDNEVTSIGNNAFSGCTTLSGIDFDYITSIGKSAFAECTSLKSIKLPTVSSIDDGAFANCTSLNKVTITSDGVITLGTNVYSGNENLKFQVPIQYYELYKIATNWNLIKDKLFSEIPNNEIWYTSTDEKIVQAPTCRSHPRSANLISNTYVNGWGVMKFDNSIVAIEDFSNRLNLESIMLPSGCDMFNQYVFSGCPSLKRIYFYSYYYPQYLYPDVFNDDVIFLVPTVESFKTQYPELADRVFPIDATIDYDVEVKAMDVGSGIQREIGEKNLALVVDLKVRGEINGYDFMVMRNKMVNLRHLDLSEATIVANDYEFLSGVHTENNKISDQMFCEWSKLSKLLLPNNITEIGIGAFARCKSIRSMIIPNSVTVMNHNTFEYCEKLESIRLSDYIQTIPDFAFDGCINLKSVNIPHFVKDINAYAFLGCSRLSEILLPKSIENIAFGAFQDTQISSITLPSSVKTIEGQAFKGCPIHSVYTSSILPFSIDQEAFDVWRTAILYVPMTDEWDATYNAYYWNTQWSQFTNLQSWTPQYEYFYVDDDYELNKGEIPGDNPDADLGKESGFIVDDGAHQDMGEVNVDSDGESGGSIIAEGGSESSDEGNVTMEKLNIKIAVQPNKWYFFCFPFDIAKEAITCDANYVFRHYDGQSRASHGNSGWKNVTETEGEYLKAGKGYIFQCDKSTDLVLTIDNPAFNGKDKKSPELDANASTNAQDANWNFVGNPFLSYFNLDDLAYNAPVTVWNGSTYEALRPGDDDYSFHPFQAFFIQKPEGVDDFEFYARGRETKKQSEKNQAKAKAMRAKKAPAADRKLINLIITDGEHVDKTRVVFNGKKTDAYEMDCDATKFMSTVNVPQIYTLDNKNVKYAINERPSGSVKLGYVATKAGTLTISVARMEQTVSIKDNETGTITPLTDGYSFETEAGTFNERLVLLLGDPTGIKELASPESSIEGQDLYNVNGVKVGSNYEGVVIARDKKYIRK